MNIRSDIQKLLLGFSLVFLLIIGSGALGIVWMRQQIAGVGARVQHLESSMAEVERRNRYLDAKIAAVHQPEYLARRVSARLAPPVKQQIIWLEVRNREQVAESSRPGSLNPLNVSLDLALLESLARPVNRGWGVP